MSNYLEKYLKYKSKYQQLKIQKGGAKLGDHTYIIETGKFWGVIVGYNSSVNEYVVLQNSTRERFLKAENEGIKWVVDNSKRPSYPSKCDIELFIVKNRSRSDVVWFNPEEETQPKISPRGAAAVSPRGMAAPVSSKLTLIELARTNTKFQEWIVKRTKSGLTSELLFESDTFRDLLTDDAFIELYQSFDQDVETEWMKVGRQARNLPTTDVKSAEARIRELSSIIDMTKYCNDCGNQVKLGTKCPVTQRYHMIGN